MAANVQIPPVARKPQLLSTTKLFRRLDFTPDLNRVLEEIYDRINQLTLLVAPLAGVPVQSPTQQLNVSGGDRYPSNVTAPSAGLLPTPIVNTSDVTLLQGLLVGYSDENKPVLASAVAATFIRAAYLLTRTAAAGQPLFISTNGSFQLRLDADSAPAAGSPCYLSWTNPGYVTDVRPPSTAAVRRQMLGVFLSPRDPANDKAWVSLEINMIVSGTV